MRESITKRFEELIERGYCLSKLPNTGSIGWRSKYRRWKLGCLNALAKTFGKESDHYHSFQSDQIHIDRKKRVRYGIACMESANEEIEKGFLYKIGHLISDDFFDSVLQHAEYLLSQGHKDPAAILGRVVIEKTLKRIAERESIALPEKVKLSTVNQKLWKNKVYTKVTWRLIQGYVHLGNFAAHGKFDKYDEKDVEDMLNWIKKNLLSL